MLEYGKMIVSLLKISYRKYRNILISYISVVLYKAYNKKALACSSEIRMQNRNIFY